MTPPAAICPFCDYAGPSEILLERDGVFFDLLDTIYGALGCIDIGRGDHEYQEAIKAMQRLRAILNVDDSQMSMAPELEDAYGEIESLQVRIGQMARGLSEYEANEDAWPDDESAARHNRVTERMAARGE